MQTNWLHDVSFDHVGVSVANLEIAQGFYSNVLGFAILEEVFQLPGHDIRGAVLVNRRGARVELFERKGSRASVKANPIESTLTRGWFQVALAVDDVHRAFEQTVAAGAAVAMSPRRAPDERSWIAFIADPDGNLIELIQRAQPIGSD